MHGQQGKKNDRFIESRRMNLHVSRLPPRNRASLTESLTMGLLLLVGKKWHLGGAAFHFSRNLARRGQHNKAQIIFDGVCHSSGRNRTEKKTKTNLAGVISLAGRLLEKKRKIWCYRGDSKKTGTRDDCGDAGQLGVKPPGGSGARIVINWAKGEIPTGCSHAMALDDAFARQILIILIKLKDGVNRVVTCAQQRDLSVDYCPRKDPEAPRCSGHRAAAHRAPHNLPTRGEAF